MKHIAYISIGSNLGNRALNIQKSISALLKFSNLIASASFYETASWGYHDDSNYINTVIKIKTNLPPLSLLASLQNIETKMGRKKNSIVRYVSRIIDLDILFFDQLIINMNQLIIPHPKLYDRNFVLVPLTEIAPELICPKKNKKIMQLLLDSKDQSKIEKYVQ